MTAIATTFSPASPFSAFRAFVTLEIRRSLRNRRYVMFAITFPVLFYLLYTGVLVGASADSGTMVAGIPWRTFFMVSMATYATIGAALGGAIVIATERESGWTRQLRVTPLPPRAYVAGKLVVSCLVTMPAIAAVLLAGLLVNHVDLSTVTWVELLVVLALGSLPFAALGLLIGYLFDSNSAQGAMMITYFTLAILGGLWAPLSSFPDTLATIGRMLPSFRLADLGRAVAGGSGIDPVDVVLLVACTAVVCGLATWRYRSSEQRVSG